ncbi:MAG: hypothetical protein GC179_30730 [Anaerolineaceae bacterium]|nr:hypothetical protein [Anaerolineaceae bacterium]
MNEPRHNICLDAVKMRRFELVCFEYGIDPAYKLEEFVTEAVTKFLHQADCGRVQREGKTVTQPTAKVTTHKEWNGKEAMPAHAMPETLRPQR